MIGRWLCWVEVELDQESIQEKIRKDRTKQRGGGEGLYPKRGGEGWRRDEGGGIEEEKEGEVKMEGE